MYPFSEFWKANDPGGGSGGTKDVGGPDSDATVAGGPGEVGILESPFVRWAADLDASDCLRLDVQIEQEIARWEAARLVVRARFARLRPPELDGSDQRYQAFDEFAGDELAAELKLSPAVGGRRLAFAVSAVRRMPAAVNALSFGTIDLERLNALERLTANLTDEQADEVAGGVLSNGGGRPSHNAFAAAVRRRVIKVDPQGAERRRRKAAMARRVTMRAEADGMGRISALLPAERMLAAFRKVDGLAKKAGSEQDRRDLDQRRADVLYDLIMGRDHDRINLEMQVIVPVECLLGLAEKPGEIPGYGPIPAGIVREMAANPRCTWRRILTDPVEGQVVETASRRFPSAALARHVRVRNPTCVFPGCDKRSAACDLDHTKPHGQHGPTDEGNLGPECRRHHRLKHAGDRPTGAAHPAMAGPVTRWKVRQVRPGHFIWTSPEGRTYRVGPERHDEK
ncbi:HNH endonuclease signature motif containing protein [Frankia sp. AiPs1]|uniref:HNH endonuclease signature motif containing protein n=1 Tax=Frankia sp. AiPs1 TaxID=573493 RepID=UPI00204362F8|nr:HNH endonuclease signature motif containing protein [Frankia sp. AiPs1]